MRSKELGTHTAPSVRFMARLAKSHLGVVFVTPPVVEFGDPGDPPQTALKTTYWSKQRPRGSSGRTLVSQINRTGGLSGTPWAEYLRRKPNAEVVRDSETNEYPRNRQ